MDWNLTRWRLGAVLRVVLGVVWAWASWEKLQEPRQFLRAVRAYDATPEWLSKAIAYGLPMLELILAVLLILGLLTRIAASISAFLLTVFLIGIVQAWARGLQIECGCFGGGGLTSDPSYWLDVLRDLALLAIAVYLILWPLTYLSIDGQRAAKYDVPTPSAKQLRSRDGQRRYESQVAKARREQRNESLYITGSIGVIAALICAIAIGVQADRAAIEGSLEATNASVEDGIVWGSAAAPVTVDIYEDFHCPVCADFEQATGEDLATLVTEGKIKVKYHPMAILDAKSSSRYSSRAANAAICASDVSVDDFQRFHAFLLGVDERGEQNQPAEGGPGISDGGLIDYGSAVGLTTTGFTTCIQGETHKALVEAMTDHASQNGITSTPTILVNGEEIEPKEGDATLSAAVLRTINEAVSEAQAEGKAFAPYTPAPAPNASPSSMDGGATDGGADPSAEATPTEGEPVPSATP